MWYIDRCFSSLALRYGAFLPDEAHRMESLSTRVDAMASSRWRFSNFRARSWITNPRSSRPRLYHQRWPQILMMHKFTCRNVRDMKTCRFRAFCGEIHKKPSSEYPGTHSVTHPPLFRFVSLYVWGGNRCNDIWTDKHGEEGPRPYWKWEPRNCRLEEVNAARFCRVMEGRKGLLLVGKPTDDGFSSRQVYG